MQTTKKIIEDIISREGGFVDHPNDKGGPTKYGITRTPLTHYLGRETTAEDIKSISKKDAFEIYYRQYFQIPKIDELPAFMCEIMLDMSVNHGPKRAIKILQRTLLLQQIDIKVDGIIGPKTRDAINQALNYVGKHIFINCIVTHRVVFYERIVNNDETQRVFLAGWIKRAESFWKDEKIA